MNVINVFLAAVLEAFGARVGWLAAIAAVQMIAALTGWVINRLGPSPAKASRPDRAPAANAPCPPPKPRTDD